MAKVKEPERALNMGRRRSHKEKKGKNRTWRIFFFFGYFIIVSLINFDRTCNKKEIREREREMGVKIYLLLYYNESNLAWQKASRFLFRKTIYVWPLFSVSLPHFLVFFFFFFCYRVETRQGSNDERGEPFVIE